jgi:hypothetical protein
MFIIPGNNGGTSGGGGGSGLPLIVGTYPAATQTQLLAAARAVRLDESSTPGLLYIGTAEIHVHESEPVWIISRFELAAGELRYALALAAWDDRLALDYNAPIGATLEAALLADALTVYPVELIIAAGLEALLFADVLTAYPGDLTGDVATTYVAIPYTTSGIVVSASSTFSGTYPAEKAFDGIATSAANRWIPRDNAYDDVTGLPTGALEWWQIDFGAVKNLARIQIYSQYHGPSDTRVFGSATGAFAGEEALVHTFANIFPDGAGTSTVTSQTVDITTPQPFRYFRFVIDNMATKADNNDYFVINEFNFWELV